MNPSERPFVSVVVPTYNRRASLVRLLETLSSQTYPAEHLEVLVVDDGSTDGTAELVQSIESRYALGLLQQPNRGPAAARNLGVEHAGGEVIVFLDDDVAARPELIAEHLVMRETQRDIVVIGPMSPPGDWPRPAWIRWEEEKLQRQYRAMLAGLYACSHRQFYTGNASLPRARFLEVGGFDPDFKRAEDVELAHRLAARGVQFVFNPRADVLHYAARSFAAWSRTPYQYGRYDVIMDRDKGYGALRDVAAEYHRRHPLNRFLAEALVGRATWSGIALRTLSWSMHRTARLGAAGICSALLSAIFNLRYWQGVHDEIGGRSRLLDLLRNAADPQAGDRSSAPEREGIVREDASSSSTATRRA